MKKSLIVGAGVAALSMAALPFAGVFANHNLVEELTVIIPASCTIRNSNTSINATSGQEADLSNSYTVTMQNGQLRSDIGLQAADATTSTTPDNTVYVYCNQQSGADAQWKLSALGTGASSHENDLYYQTGNATIETGTGTSGADSQWAFAVTLGSGITVANGFVSDTFYAVPDSTPKQIAQGTGSAGSDATPAFTTYYQVYVSDTQAAGTYTGEVTYTLTNPATFN